MDTIRRLKQRCLRSRWLPAAGIGLTLLVFAGAIALGMLQLRDKIRNQIVTRGAEVLHGVAQMVQVTQDADRELGGQIEDVTDQFAIALQLSQLNQFNGVIATRLFDTNGQSSLALPANVAPARLPEADLRELKALRPVSRFHPDARVASLFGPGTARPNLPPTAPLLEVFIPLHRQDHPALFGIVGFVMDGAEIAAQFVVLDRHLATQGALVFAAGAVLIVGGLSWAFRRLGRANRLLRDRTLRLQRANAELALAAKTSAVGAITAHLIHGLSNPLSGLHEIVTNRARADLPQDEWEDAVTSARQMQELIGEIVRVLNEEQACEDYEIALSHLEPILRAKLAPMSQKAGVALAFDVAVPGVLPNREVNLVLLILENLLRNAIQATPAGRAVRVTVTQTSQSLDFEVQDQGTGVAPEMKAKLFSPVRSGKQGGHGIGLAICRQLAQHLDAVLELKATSAHGSTFVLRLAQTRPVPDRVNQAREREV